MLELSPLFRLDKVKLCTLHACHQLTSVLIVKSSQLLHVKRKERFVSFPDGVKQRERAIPQGDTPLDYNQLQFQL